MDLEDLAFTTFIRNTNLGDNFFTNIHNFCNESMHDKDIPDFKNLQLCLHVASKMQDEGLIQKCAFEAIQKSCLKIISEICDSYIINVLENFQNSVDILKCIQQIIELCCKICGNEIEHSICSLLPNLFKILDADDYSRENQMAVLNILSCILQCTPANILTKKSNIWEKLFSQSMLSRKFVNVTLISKILPIMVTKLDYHSEAFILTYVWDYIRSKPLTVEKDCSCNDMQDTFVMLNTLVDISLNTQYLQQKYISEVFFWEILFRGFVHNTSVVRKQVQCIFKKILSWAKNSPTCIKLPSYLYTYFIYDSTSLVIKDSMAVWDDLLSCFEVLEQKQLHIIKPHLPKVLHLLQLSKHSGNNMSETAFCLNTSWVMTLLQRMWKHDAKYIRHWSAVCVVNQQDPCIFLNYDENFTYLFFDAFFKVLNDPSIYARPEYDATESLYITHKDIGNFFSVCCNSFPTIVKTGHFLQLVLNILSNSSYSSVPLLYIVKAISQMPSCQAWKRTDVPNILHLLRRALQTQDLLLQRSVIHNLLKSAIELLDMKDLHYCDLCLFLNAFFDCNALIPKSLLWTTIAGSLRKHLSCENSLLDVNILRELCYKDRTSLLNSMQENHTNFDLAGPGMYLESVKHITQTWAVLVEAKVFCSESCEIKNMHHCLSFPTFASPFFKLVETTLAQPLVLSTVTRNILTVHFYLVEEILQQNSCFDYECRKALEFVGKILYRVTEEICVLHNIEDLEWICFALRILDALLKNRNNNPNENLILMILKQYVNQLEKDFQAINQVQFWCFIGKIALYAEKKSIASEYIATIMQKVIGNTCLTLSFKKPRFVKYETSKNLWLNCVENATISICHCLQLYIAFHIDGLSELNILSIYQQVLDILKEENKVHIPLLLKCIELILLKIENDNFVCEALAVSWNCLKTWGFYRPALKAFISMCFQPHLLKKDLPLLMQYVKKLKTLEDRPACLSMLYIHICQVFKVDENRANCFEYISFLSYGLLYGPMRRKDQRVVTEAIESIMDEELVDEKLSLMCMKADFHIRLEVIHVVLTTIEAGSAEKFICLFIEDLLLKQEEITQNKPSYFLNSYQHRVQNRVWQSILLLNELLAMNLSRKKLLLKILKNSFTQNSQISVKYFQDWTVLRIVYFHTELLSEIFAVTQECFNQPPSYQVRLLSILIHLIELNVINSPDLALQWMPLILKFCVAHNFEIRLYAALALQSMWKYCSKHSYFHVLEKFDFVQGSELTNPKSGNFPRNIDNLRQGYYFSSFHPMKSFNFQTIFVDLLFYSNVTMQEWIQPSHFLEKHKMHPFPDCFKIFNQNDVLKVLPGSYMCEAQSQISSSKNTFINCNFQRKFVPQKVCDKFLAVDCNNTETSESQSCKELDLIVVASLVEKLPNLGGLCRSCEALGVSEFIVKDFKSTEHKMFQSLSVTAEKWITISEVKVHQLKKYLVRMKSKNYSIIGCEQTEKSQKITEFTFPMKSLILLGHEKEGIPVEFLEYLDVSIEIPQSGVIRSLNVHVAGALLIYEFFRQHKRI